jgi:hypothetical protein
MGFKTVLSAVFMVVLMAAMAIAQDEPEGEMPPMGPPEQMKEIAFLDGAWDVEMEWVDEKDPTKWIKETAVCTYSDILGGCAKQMSFVGDMMGMPFQGLMIQSYDREKGEWQSAWIDNFEAKVTLFTGQREGDKITLSGESIWKGQKYLSRMSSFNHTEESFDWTMESSFDGGKTWILSGKAKYTKQ